MGLFGKKQKKKPSKGEDLRDRKLLIMESSVNQ